MALLKSAKLKFTGILLLLVGVAFWWLLLEGSAPATAPQYFEIEKYRNLANSGGEPKPTELRIEIVGTDIAPGIAAETGGFGSKYHVGFTSLQAIWPNKSIVIGGAVDQVEALKNRQSKTGATFNTENYDRLLAAMVEAERVMLTHEHIDHIMAVVRHPIFDALAPKLLLNPDQLAGLAPLFDPQKTAADLGQITTADFTEPTLIAPSIVVARHPGHTTGNQTFFVSLENGKEYLLIGDIVWKMSNITNLKTRPRLLQYMLFEPNEDRKAVLRQVRALHDLQKAYPDLIIIPSHDLEYLEDLIKLGDLGEGFRLTKTRP